MTSEAIGLFYGSSTCYTEIAAEKIRDTIGERVQIFNVTDVPVERMQEFRLLILGIPTWDYGELQEDWEAVWEELDDCDLNQKVVALYGLGDQVGYPQWFQDAMGYLCDKVKERGAKIVGEWPVEGYNFEESQALSADAAHFVGLALDEENEFELSEKRIQLWCKNILSAFDER